MKLRNVGMVVTQGQLQGIYTSKSKWTHWPEDVALIDAASRRYQENVVAGA